MSPSYCNTYLKSWYVVSGRILLAPDKRKITHWKIIVVSQKNLDSSLPIDCTLLLRTVKGVNMIRETVWINDRVGAYIAANQTSDVHENEMCEEEWMEQLLTDKFQLVILYDAPGIVSH